MERKDAESLSAKVMNEAGPVIASIQADWRLQDTSSIQAICEHYNTTRPPIKEEYVVQPVTISERKGIYVSVVFDREGNTRLEFNPNDKLMELGMFTGEPDQIEEIMGTFAAMLKGKKDPE